MRALVERRLAVDDQLIPTKIYGAGGLQQNAEHRLEKETEAHNPVIQSVLTAKPAAEAA
jgi:hypothetical protein